jgi:hypothetical protein
MALATHEFINGLFSLIFVSISVMVGLTIASRFLKYKDRNLLLVGATWIFMCEPWWSVSINFLLILFTGQSLTLEIYLLIGYLFIPVGLVSWIIALTNLKYKKKQVTIIIIITTISVLYEVLFFYFFITDISMIGVLQGPVDVKYGIFMLSSLLIVLVIAIITGVLFARTSMRSDNPEIKLKGKFILIAFISYFIGSVFSVFSSYSIIFLIIARTMTILASIEFYCGFILPSWVKKRFLK